MTFFLMIFYTWFKFNDQKYKVEDIEYSIIFSILFKKVNLRLLFIRNRNFYLYPFFLEII